ncbi:MAG: crossover junction endodeoxyribonuclease RuvC [Gammaproteobacteria bacterium]|nr:crossover junction endodeoxyribonuclease RuvC [Gammaproteobacteria bacterium]
MTRVLGIDPGSVVTGYGVIDTDGHRNIYVDHGHIRVKGDSFAERLGHIHRSIVEVVDQWQPIEAAVEQVFVSNNPMSALKLGQARGAAITAVVAADMAVFEYSARSIKQVVAGTGSAEKKQIQTMVKAQLDIQRVLQADAADGLAVAICHAHSRQSVIKGVSVSPRRKARGRGLRW